MAIDKIGSGQPIAPAKESIKSKAKKAEESDSKDRVHLSDEAKLLYAAEKAKKLGEIRAKVKNGFYEGSEVTEKVVEGLMRDLKRAPQA